jgi:2TM domain-containing protein
MTDIDDDSDPRRAAVKRIKARRDFWLHLLMYAVLNGAFIALWATTGQGYFWPMWVLAGWGIGVIANAWQVFARPISEEQIRREMSRHHHA